MSASYKMSEAVESFVCPRCRQAVIKDDGGFRCGPCDVHYPRVCGIPDFRVFADPYIGISEDREKACHLFDASRTRSFRELVEYYFQITPEVPEDLARGYAAWLLSDAPEARARSMVAHLGLRGVPRLTRGSLLEVGSGSGPMQRALTQSYARVVQADIALRWLVIARKRAEENGARAEYVSCCAEALPFAPNAFDAVLGASLIEHARDPSQFLRECLRVLDKDGVCMLTTPNRWSLGPDPHLGVWGLGLLPSPVQAKISAFARGLPFDKVHTRGYAAWTEVLLGAGFRRVEFALPDPPKGLGGVRGVAAQAYGALKGLALPRALLLVVGPAFEIYAYKGPNRS